MLHLEDRKLMTIDMTMAPPPTAVAGQDLGSPTLASFTFTNGSAADYTATIDWGDGAVTDGVITPDPDGSEDVSGDFTYATSGPMNVEVTVQGDGEGAAGMTSMNVGSGSGSGAGSGGGSGSGGGVGTMPDGMSQDLSLIGSESNLSVNTQLLAFSYLMINGGTPWDDLKPGDMQTQDVTNSSTETFNGNTLTTTDHLTTSASGDGTPGASGGGSWSISYQANETSSQVGTGVDPYGRNSTSSATETSDETWDAWGDNGGPTHYSVVSDNTQDYSLSLKSGQFDEEEDNPSNAHLTAEGVVASDGHLMSGDFTYSGNIGVVFSLTDGSGSPSGPAVGDSVSYTASTAETLSEGGDLIPDSSDQGGITLNSSENGNVSITDGQGASTAFPSPTPTRSRRVTAARSPRRLRTPVAGPRAPSRPGPIRRRSRFHRVRTPSTSSTMGIRAGCHGQPSNGLTTPRRTTSSQLNSRKGRSPMAKTSRKA